MGGVDNRLTVLWSSERCTSGRERFAQIITSEWWILSVLKSAWPNMDQTCLDFWDHVCMVWTLRCRKIAWTKIRPWMHSENCERNEVIHLSVENGSDCLNSVARWWQRYDRNFNRKHTSLYDHGTWSQYDTTGVEITIYDGHEKPNTRTANLVFGQLSFWVQSAVDVDVPGYCRACSAGWCWIGAQSFTVTSRCVLHRSNYFSFCANETESCGCLDVQLGLWELVMTINSVHGIGLCETARIFLGRHWRHGSCDAQSVRAQKLLEVEKLFDMCCESTMFEMW